MLIAQAGFEAVYLSGYSVAASHARPDIGLVTATQMVAHAAALVEASGLPVIADADTGYGSLVNIADTVRAYERAGVAALHIEDQQSPKRCGAMAGKKLVGDAEMAQRLRAARAARRGDILIIGRTDAMTIDACPRRCAACSRWRHSARRGDAVAVVAGRSRRWRRRRCRCARSPPCGRCSRRRSSRRPASAWCCTRSR
jgi:2-methylisocitrate lyase-like PEP mutase family enzyme